MNKKNNSTPSNSILNNGIPSNGILKVRNLTFSYQEKIILDIPSFDLNQGAFLGIVGPNGAGKSTLIKCLLSLIGVNKNTTILFWDEPYKKVQKRITYIPQKSTLDWNFPMSVLDFVMLGSYGKLGWIKRPGKEEKELSLQALRQLSMDDFTKHSIGELSGGQRQRILIARALVQDGDLFILDEPTQGIDDKSEKIIFNILKELIKKKTIMMVHHNLSHLKKYFSEVVFLNKKIISQGEVKKVFNNKNIIETYS